MLMTMSILEAFAVVVLLFAVASLPYWMKRGPARVRFPGVSTDLRAQLGDTLASWLVATRDLRSEVIAFDHCAREMLAGELAERLPSGHRPYSRDLADVNFLADIRKLRRAGHAWLEQLATIPEADRRRFEIELAELTGLFELPWAYEHSDERVNDRSGEIQQILAQCSAAGDILARIDAALSTPPDSPYR
jgi:hypothetical protein